MAITKDQVVSAIFGFDKVGSKYPAPWNKAASGSVWDAKTRTVGIQSPRYQAAKQGGKDPVLSCNVIYAKRNLFREDGDAALASYPKHFYAISNNGKSETLLMEYHSSQKDHPVFVLAYELDGNVLSGCRINMDDKGNYLNTSPIKVRVGGMNAGSVNPSNAAYATMVLLALTYMGKGGTGGSFTVQDYFLTAMKELSEDPRPCSEELQHSEPLGAISAELYRVLRDAPSILDSISLQDGSITELTEDELTEYAEDAKVLTHASPNNISGPMYPLCGLKPEETIMFNGSKGGSSSAPTTKLPSLEELRTTCKLETHTLLPSENAMIPKLDDHYVVDERLVRVATRIKRDWHDDCMPLAPNIILEGDAGSGKTTGSKFLAHVFGCPWTKITMHPYFESANLIGSFYPCFTDMDEWPISDEDKAALVAIRSILEENVQIACGKNGSKPNAQMTAAGFRHAFDREEVRDKVKALYHLPTSEDWVIMTPEEIWTDVMGMEDPVPTDIEVEVEATRRFEAIQARLINILIDQAESGSVQYRFVLSELMRAFENGWLVEIQEAATVLRPGVLTELNSLLEKNGRIELANGKHIYRHPDTIVVFTTNRDYEGTTDLNESLRDRCVMGVKMDTPSVEVLAKRAINQLHLDDTFYQVALNAAKTLEAVSNAAKAKNIKGIFGTRSLVGWMRDLADDDYSAETFQLRVLSKMTTRDEDVQELMTVFQSSWMYASQVATGRRGKI